MLSAVRLIALFEELSQYIARPRYLWEQQLNLDSSCKLGANLGRISNAAYAVERIFDRCVRAGKP